MSPEEEQVAALLSDQGMELHHRPGGYLITERRPRVLASPPTLAAVRAFLINGFHVQSSVASVREKAECAEREVKQRGRVYPRWVADRRMTQAFADKQIATMEEIAADYRKVADAEADEGMLF